MLTKDLLRFTKRNQRVYPQLVKAEQALPLITQLLDVIAVQPQLSVGEFEEIAADLPWSDPKLKDGLLKIIIDQCQLKDVEDDIESFRWKAFAAMQAQFEQSHPQSGNEFYQQVAQGLDIPLDQIRKRLYCDLPSFRTIVKAPTESAEDLVHLYNCQLLQSLLLRSKEVRITIKGATLPEKRALFRHLRFHNLIADEMSIIGDEWTFTLSGPLAVFDMAARYGMNLALFFPHLLNLKRWDIAATLNIANKNYQLIVDQTCGINSPYAKATPYIPEEFTVFIAAFNEHENNKNYHVELADEFMNLGKESYSFPDFVIYDKKRGKSYFVELFHRWHVHQFKSRLDALKKHPAPQLIAGVSNQVAKKKELSAPIKSSKWFDDHGFTFTDFPTPLKVMSVLDKLP